MHKQFHPERNRIRAIMDRVPHYWLGDSGHSGREFVVIFKPEDTKRTKATKRLGLDLSHAIIGSAIEVHRLIGPGLIESVYELALCRELWLRGMVSNGRSVYRSNTRDVRSAVTSSWTYWLKKRLLSKSKVFRGLCQFTSSTPDLPEIAGDLARPSP